MQQSERPPLGVIPRWRWLELRIMELGAAMDRFAEAGESIPPEWATELSILWREITDERRKQRVQKGVAGNG